MWRKTWFLILLPRSSDAAVLGYCLCELFLDRWYLTRISPIWKLKPCFNSRQFCNFKPSANIQRPCRKWWTPVYWGRNKYAEVRLVDIMHQTSSWTRVYLQIVMLEQRDGGRQVVISMDEVNQGWTAGTEKHGRVQEIQEEQANMAGSGKLNRWLAKDWT